MKPKIIKATNLIEKQNILNEVKSTYMTLQEARIFAVYLSKINPRNISTRVVKFRLNDFTSLLGIEKINISKLMESTNRLLSIILNIPIENGGYKGFQLFKTCTVYKDNKNEWYIEIDAHDESLPLMFDFHSKYFSYHVGNVLRLASSNQMRMYEILKQYEKIGERIVSLEELKELLGISTNEYPRFGDFKNRVLESCRKSLSTYTDIEFTYEPTGKKGKGGKVQYLKFVIKKNKSFVDQLTLSELIEQQTFPESRGITEDRYFQRQVFMSSACDDEFDSSEIQVLINIAHKTQSDFIFSDDIKLFHYFKSKYDEMEMRSKKNKISNRFAYLKTMFDAELQ